MPPPPNLVFGPHKKSLVGIHVGLNDEPNGQLQIVIALEFIDLCDGN